MRIQAAVHEPERSTFTLNVLHSILSPDLPIQCLNTPPTRFTSLNTYSNKRTWNTLALGRWAIASSRSRFLTVWAFQNYTKKKTRCLPSLVAHATSVATSVTTPRSALRLSVSATTASSQATSPTTARTLALLRVCLTVGQRMYKDDTDLSHRQAVLPLPGSRTRAG